MAWVNDTNPGALLSRLIRLQPLGAVISLLLDKRALTDATSTSPTAVVAGRLSVKAVPQVDAVETAPPEGRALSAGPAPEIVAPRTSASANNGICRRICRTTGGVVMVPLHSGRAGGNAVLRAWSVSDGSRLGSETGPIRQLASGSGL
jgi:hypothetical protein